MSRTLFLLRHAKSSWEDGSLRDDERPLAPRGRRAAVVLRAHFHATGIAPDVVLCSTARRTRETWDLVRTGLPATPEVEFRQRIYLATAGDLFGVIQSVRPDANSVLIIGHNPGMEDLANSLVGDVDEAVEQLGHGFPTGTFASLTLSVEWADAAPGTALLDHLVRPRELPDTIEG